MRFTEEELAIAKSVDLCAVAESLGYTVKRVGRFYTLKEMDSMRIYDRSHWFRWSKQYEKGENGGSQIDFLRVFAGMSVKEAVFWLVDFAGCRREHYESEKGKIKVPEEKKPDRKEFVLPKPAADNRYLISYLTKERRIRLETVNYFLAKRLLYESAQYHNLVFCGKDAAGVVRFASMRGVFDRDGKSFKCDVAGNDKRYGFNDVHEECSRVFVFESAIDLMSYTDMFDDYTSNKVALGMLGDAPLATFLEEHPHIRSIGFCLDNDEPGRKATGHLLEKYQRAGYEVSEIRIPAEYKDMNEWHAANGSKGVKTAPSGVETAPRTKR
jgi:hypothetical protein